MIESAKFQQSASKLTIALGKTINGEAVHYKMPPDTPLHDEDIALIEKWLLAGAPGVP